MSATERGATVAANEVGGTSHHPGRVHRSPLRGAARHPYLTALIVVLLWVLLGALVPLAAAALPLLSGREAAEAGQQALVNGDFETAHDELEEAERLFGRGRLALRNPVAWMGGLLPGLGQNVRTAGAVAAAGELAAGGGRSVIAGVLDLPDGVDSLRPTGGQLPLDALGTLEPALRVAGTDLQEAQTLVERSPRWLLHPRILAAREELEGRLDMIAPTAESAQALARALPAFLGAEGEKRYFFGASNPAEMRGTGGFVGAFTILTVNDGRLQFGEFAEIHDLPQPRDAGAVEAPSADFAARYDRYGGPGSWLSLNVTPDFREAGHAFVNLYESAVGDQLDGVVVADPHAMAELFRLAGPTHVPGVGPMEADEVVDYVTNEAYADFDDRVERKEVLGDVAAAALGAFLQNGRADAREVLTALGRIAAGGHLLLYANDQEVQSDLETAGLAGRIPLEPGDLVMPVLNSSSNAKIDFYLEMDATYDVTLLEGGASRGQLSVALHNGAPTTGQPKYVIGPNRREVEAGENRFVFFSYCGRGCEILGFDRDGEIPDRSSLETEHGLGVAVVPVVQLASGEETVLNAKWDLPGGAWTAHEGVMTYTLSTRLQPFVQSPSLTVRVEIPEGTRPMRLPPGARVEADHVVFTVTEVGLRRHEVEFVRGT